MNRTMTCTWCAAVALSVAAYAAPAVDTGTLIHELVDLRRLCEFPEPAYKTVQYSSYDRASCSPGGPGWFANADGFGGEASPNFEAVVKAPGEDGIGEYLICDVSGAGAIVRTWTAAIAGQIRLYLDDATEPLYDGPAEAFLQCPYRELAKAHELEWDYPSGTLQQHEAGYCPIPFAKRCRMVWIGKLNEVHFYHVQVREYEAGVDVQTFRVDDLKTFAAALKDATAILAAPGRAYPLVSQAEPVEISATIAGGADQRVLELTGPGALERLTLRVAASDLDRALRQTILRVICDGYPHGQVQSPLGDFFGAAPGVNPYDSLPFTVAPDGTMTCRYVMPFETSLRIVLDNRGREPVTVTGSAWPLDYQWTERSMHFRARWRVDHDVLGLPDRTQDLPLLIARGAGRCVGAAVMLMNPCAIPTPWGGWWGEGDEKIFVDDDVLPSTFGTGSEDYFNYAWSVPDIFAHAYCGQPRNDGPGNRGFVTNNRWHVIDDLPFQHSFAFYIELKPHDRVPGMSYARMAYHYARPGTIDDHVAITNEDVRPLKLPADWKPAAGFGMRGAVFFEAETLAQAGAKTALEQGNLWAGSQLLVWRPKSKGGQLELRLKVAEAGKYAVHAAFRLSPAAGRVAAKLDGEPTKAGGQDAFDLYVPYRVLSRQFRVFEGELAAGEHTLTLVFEGAPETVDQPAIGVDYVAVQKR